MVNALTHLLRKPALTRQASDYEAVFDDFIHYAGGTRVEKAFEVPPNTKNADYYILTDRFELIIELKQMNRYCKDKTIDAYFSRLISGGHLTKYQTVGSNQIRINPNSLTQHQWHQFYAKFRPSVTGHLDKAARQLKATNSFIPQPTPERPRYFAAVLMNSNDFNLSTDLMYRLVEYRTKNKWHRGLYSCLDFVSCLSLDLVQDTYHPLHCRHIARNLEEPLLIEAVRYFFDHWINYGAEGYGAAATFVPGATEDDLVRPDTKVRGKLFSKS